MKINLNFGGFRISAKGMGIQRKKMDLVAENIANIDTTKMADGGPYQRKYLRILNNDGNLNSSPGNSSITLQRSDDSHFTNVLVSETPQLNEMNIEMSELKDDRPGDMVFMPDHPDANEEGYVLMPNVNIITEMVDMIAATRGYEANVTAFNSAKQIAKDSLEI